jgi:hypothetical protein
MLSALILSATIAFFPAVQTLEPSSGVAGTIVTIKGTNLMPPGCRGICPSAFPTFPPTVTVGGKPARLVESHDDFVKAEIPLMGGGAYDVTITTADGSVTLDRAFVYGAEGDNDPRYTLIGRTHRLLIPVVANRVPGAFGSIWLTELTGRGSYPETLPEMTAPAELLYVEAPEAFHLRIRDVTRQAEGWGTEVPVVPVEEAFVNDPMEFPNIPYEPASRVTLRVYDFDGPLGAGVDVQVYAGNTAQLLGQAHYTLSSAPVVFMQDRKPGYLQLDVKSIAPAVENVQTARVVVVNRDGNRLWGLVSVTNNATSQILTITPFRPIHSPF